MSSEYSKCLPVARVQARRRLRQWSMPSSLYHSVPLQLTHQSDATSNHSHPVLLTGRLIALDSVINCIKVRPVQCPEIWKFIQESYIIAFSDLRQWWCTEC